MRRREDTVELSQLRAEARRYKNEGYQAVKLRFGWGPVDGAKGMQRNLDLVRTVAFEGVDFDLQKTT